MGPQALESNLLYSYIDSSRAIAACIYVYGREKLKRVRARGKKKERQQEARQGSYM